MTVIVIVIAIAIVVSLSRRAGTIMRMKTCSPWSRVGMVAMRDGDE